MKKLFKSLIIIFVLIILAGCSKENSHIKKISLDKFKEKIANKESFALYIGNKDCVHCENYRPTLDEVLDEYNINIYQIDNSKLSEKEYNEFKTYISISGTPTIVFITDGEEETTLNRIVGELSKEDTVEIFKTNGYIK